MAQSKRGKSGHGIFSSAVVLVVLAIVVVAFVQQQGGIAGVWDWAKEKAGLAQEKADKIQSEGVSLPEMSSDANDSTETSTSVSASEAVSELASLKIAERSDSDYDRDSYNHWINVSGSSCWDTREEALYRGAESGTIVLLDKDKNETTDKNSACSIKSGKWIDPYTGKEITKSRSLDIDHIVPLSLANDSGADKWDSAKKQEFANDVDNNLLAVSASANRSKGDKGLAEWLPSNDDFKCEYVEKFVNVLNKYGLTITQADHDKAEDVLKSC